MAAAGGDTDRFTFPVFHAGQRQDMVARGMHTFQTVANGESVFDLDFHEAAGGIESDGIADVEAAIRFGAAAQVVLVLGIVMTLQETIGVATVGQTFELAEQGRVERLAGDGVVDGLAVSLAGARDVIRALGATFDLQRIDADFDQTVHMLDGAQILRIEDVGAVLVFLDRHEFARTLLFFEQVLDFIFDQFFRLTVGTAIGSTQFVIPAAGIGAAALIRVAVIEVAGEQAAARVGDAQRAVDEDFEFDVGATLADFGDFVERQFTRQDDALDAHLLPETNRGPIHRVGLHRQVDDLFRPGFAHHVDEAGVGHDQGVGLERDDRRHVGQIGRQLGVVRNDVADDEKLLAAGVRFVDPVAQFFDAAELVVAHAQAVAGLAGVDGVGAEIEGGAHHVERAGGGEEFRSFGHSRMQRNRAL